MAFSRSHLFPPEDQLTSFYARALSHPIRLDIIKHLINHGSTKVEDLWKKYPLSRSTISQHLRILRTAGLIHYREILPFTYYWVNTPTLQKAKLSLRGFLDEVAGN
jgi:DNA-binding transcriptional ArsR family regulator